MRSEVVTLSLEQKQQVFLSLPKQKHSHKKYLDSLIFLFSSYFVHFFSSLFSFLIILVAILFPLSFPFLHFFTSFFFLSVFTDTCTVSHDSLSFLHSCSEVTKQYADLADDMHQKYLNQWLQFAIQVTGSTLVGQSFRS